MSLYDELYETVSKAVWTGLKNDQEPPTQDALYNIIAAQLMLSLSTYPRYKELKGTFDEEAFIETLAKDYWSKNAVRQTGGNYLFSSESNEPWLPEFEAAGLVDWAYWERYRAYLEEDMGWSRSVCDTIGKDAWDILSLTHDPRDEHFSTKGLVIGNVQSGKTANYLGLLCRAADVGYKYLVVLAATTNDLREQTQKRIEEGFIGFRLVQDESDKKLFKTEYVGVGDGVPESFRHPNPGTSRQDDFKKAKMETFLQFGADNVKEPWVFVIKKNVSTLNNLITWLRQQNISKEDRLLLIDDEADYASINTKASKDKISTINRLIRDLYLLFPCRTYIGYTATPYANILIDRDANDEEHGEDLFPRNFIYTLSPSDSYFGADKIFADVSDEEEGIGRCRYVRFIDDCVAPNKKDVDILDLPETLKDAIRTFLLAATLWKMRLNGRSQNMTMLVNVTQFNHIQRQYRTLIDYYVEDEIVSPLKLYSSLPADMADDNSRAIRELHRIWNCEYGDACGLSWEKVLPRLLQMAKSLRTALINSASIDSLEYETGQECVIAIGGNRLSRGLTLEGLIVSYFARNSRAYDTLMQMSRWFGHRTGYEDLCRVWMTAESAGWCRYISDSTNDLIADLVRMQRKGATPSEFGLKIRAHPSTLMVTARNKMGSGELRRNIALDGRYIETFALLRGAADVEANFKDAKTLISSLELGRFEHERYEDELGYLGEVIYSVPAKIIEDFVANFRNCNDSKATQPESVLRHIGYCKDEGAIQWDVLLAASEGQQTSKTFMFCGQEYGYERRSPGIKIDTERLFVSNRNKVSTKNPERAGLSQVQLAKVLSEYEERKNEPHHPSIDCLCRMYRTRPLLVIHHLDMRFPNEASYRRVCKTGDKRFGKFDGSQWSPDHNESMIAWSISFPVLDIEKETEYVFNKVALEGMYQGDDGADEDDEFDEDE